MKIIRKFLPALLALCLIFSMVTPALTVGAESTDLPDFGLPVISIQMDQPASAITKEEQLPATFSMFTGDEYEIIDKEITIKGRGNSTWRAPKKPYQIKFDSKTDVLGMGKAKKWVLLANYNDQTSVRNYLATDLALKLGMDYTPLMRYVDVYINNEYLGNYIICEKIESGSTRVDISDDGVILEVNSKLDENYNFTTKNGVPFSLKEPEFDPISDDMSEEEKQEITNTVASIEAEIAAIEDLIYAQDVRCFDYIDMDSFVDWYIINELYKNVDASFKSSCFMYRDGTGKFFMGPIWDFDLSLGGTDSEDMRDPSGFHINSQRWYKRLRSIPEFEVALQARWTQIRNDGTLDSFYDTLDETKDLINTSAKENLKLWPYRTFENLYGETILNLGMEIDYIKEFYASRLIWMDASLNNNPSRVNNAETMLRSLPETLVVSSSRYINTVNDYISSLDPEEKAQIDEALLEKLRVTNENYDSIDKTLGIKSVTLSSQIVYRNEPITFNCITSPDVEKIAIFNENSSALGKTNETKTILDDGNILWTFSCSFGSTGTREVSIKAISENTYETVPFTIIILNENQIKPDKSLLSALISEAEKISLQDKTDKTAQTFSTALEQAKQTDADPFATQTAINTSYDSLSKAIDNLETKPDNSVAKGTCGDNVTWELDSEGTLTISGTGEMYSYTSASSYSWYGSRYKINSVVIKDSVTSIGDYAFEDCHDLTSVTIPDSVISIGDSAFNSCYSLNSVTIPDSVTSIGDDAFYNCGRLTSLTIGNGVTSIGNFAFEWCDSLTSVVIPDSVTSIGDYAFNDCGSLTSVTIGNSVTSIGDFTFGYCLSLTNVVIPDSVTSIGKGAFEYCESLTSVTIPDSVTSIGDAAFESCDSLSDVYITDLATWCGIYFDSMSSNPLYYANNFYLNGELLTELVIPSGVTSVGDFSFTGYEGLTSVVIPDGVTKIGSFAFYKCFNLNNVTIPDSVTIIDLSAFDSCYSIESLTIPDSVREIKDFAFSSCRNLKSITFMGDAPEFGFYYFFDVRATAYYPANNATWTEEVLNDDNRGYITWVPYGEAEPEVVLEAKTDATEYLVNAPVTITVVTDKSVNNINLVNENGKYIVKTDSSCEENADGTLTWTVSTSFGTKGERSISIFTVDENGESVDSGVTVSFIVDTVISGGDDAVATYMVKAPASAVKNESFVITVETSTSTTKVGIFNESGSALGKVSQSYADKDGVRTWTIGIKIGSRGNRSFTVKATDRSGIWSDGKQVNISVK